MVLMKDFDRRGFTFFTNYESRKGAELAANPSASLLFWWDKLHRQVRIDGTVEKVDAEESAEYFAKRPRGSQIGAWSSPQSRVIDGREILERRFEETEAEHAGADVPRPLHWGGYRVLPMAIEFWQGRASRLHDRLRYQLDAGLWRMDRLAP